MEPNYSSETTNCKYVSSKGILKSGTASRKVSRLQQRINSL